MSKDGARGQEPSFAATGMPQEETVIRPVSVFAYVLVSLLVRRTVAAQGSLSAVAELEATSCHLRSSVAVMSGQLLQSPD